MRTLLQYRGFAKTAVALLATLLLTSTAFCQKRPSNRDERGLQGPVHRVATEVARFSEASGEWVEGPRKAYTEETFDATGNLVQILVDLPNISPGLQRLINEQDSDPATEERTDLIWDIYSSKKHIYTYDKNRELVEEKILQSDDTLFLYHQYVRTHDNDGRTIEVCTYEEDGSLYSKDAYSYDENGNVTEEINNADNDLLIVRTHYTYDDNGRLVKWETKFQKRPIFTENISYDDEGNKTAETLYFKDGTLVNRRVLRSDDKKRILEREESNPNGTPTSKQTYEYVNDAYGNWTRQIAYGWNIESGDPEGKPVKATYRTITYFGEP